MMLRSPQSVRKTRTPTLATPKNFETSFHEQFKEYVGVEFAWFFIRNKIW